MDDIEYYTPEERRGLIVERIENLAEDGTPHQECAPPDYDEHTLIEQLDDLADTINEFNDELGDHIWLRFRLLQQEYEALKSDPLTNPDTLLSAENDMVSVFLDEFDDEYRELKQLKDRLNAIMVNLAPTLLRLPMDKMDMNTQNTVLMVQFMDISKRRPVIWNTNIGKP